MHNMMTVHEVAKKVGVTSDAVRHYVRIGLLNPKRNPDNDYRLFSPADEKRLYFVLRAKQLGFTLSDIRKILSDVMTGASPCPRVRELLQKRMQMNQQKVNELLVMQARMEEADRAWANMPDAMASDDMLCHLIEKIGT